MAPEILVVNASPRPEGNCAHLATVCGGVFDQQGKGWERIDLRRLKIGACRGCGLCRQGKAKYCVLQDDMAPLYEKIAQCQALLLLSPIYWFTYSGQLKVFIDRLYGLWNWDRNFLAGKRAGAVLVYADADPYESGAVNAISAFEHMFRFVKADCRGFAYGTAGGPGSAANNPDLLERTRKLALRLA
ncbi:MAG TPA: flavodoxin family protein [Holophaga sp.]|nr:flavodoxin family protein [Holophaga sp.]HPS68331.1 flavodoxin family protein [Holophaga sp.]